MQLSDAVALLRENPLMVASTVSPDHTAESAMVDAVVTDDGTVVFASQPDTRKVANLAQNPSVALFAWNTGSVLSLQIDGTANVVDDGNRAWAEDLYLARFPEKQGPPNRVFIAVRPTWIRRVDLSGGIPPHVEELRLQAP